LPHQIRYLPEHRFCIVRYDGSYSGEDLIAVDREVFERTAGEGVRILFDMRQTRIVGQASAVRTYRDWLQSLDLSQTHPGLKQAIVAESPVETGLALVLANTAGEAYEIEVFSTVDGACKALGVPFALAAANADLIPV